MKEIGKHGLEARRPVRVGLYDMVFALNLASSFGYGLLICVIKRIDSAPPDDLYYFFLRAAARINDALLLSPGQVAISDMERHSPTVVEQLSRELVLLVSVFAAMTSVYLLLKMIAGTRLHRAMTTRFLGPSLLFAAPLSYLAVMHNMSWGPDNYWVPPFWDLGYRSLVLVLGAEGFAAIVSLAKPVRSVPGWLLGAFWLLHFGFWLPVLWSVLPQWSGDYVGFYVAHALVTGWFPLALIWVLRLRGDEPRMLEAGARGMAWAVLGGVSAAAMAAFIWLPHPMRRVAHPSDRYPVTVELSRGPCYGWFPRYSVRVRGNGSVEYTDYEFMRVLGKATAKLSTEQATTILQKLESVGFFGIEDRAFLWGWHTETIAVLVSAGGATHCVSSDVQFAGAKSGTQARFVQAANEIDQIIRSRR